MERLNKTQEILRDNEWDALFLVKRANVNYISRFSDEAAYALIGTNKQFLITDGRFFELAQEECKGFRIINWQKIGTSIVDAVKEICKNNGIKKLGFERAATSYDLYDRLQSSMTDVELIPTNNVIEDLRYVKDEEEIEILKEASRITDKSFEDILNFIKPGMTENEVAAKLEYIIKFNGASGVGFETILISGKKTSLPHGKPNDKVIEKGDLVTLDFGALYKGHTSDMTRTIVVGTANEKQIEIYNIVKKAQQIGLDTIKAGVTSKAPDDKIREIVKDYVEYYYPGIGHGVGRELHEQPFLGKNGDRIIEKNCIITVEPGIYIPNWGGVRIEDTIIVTETGNERLTKSSKDLICV